MGLKLINMTHSLICITNPLISITQSLTSIMNITYSLIDITLNSHFPESNVQLWIHRSRMGIKRLLISITQELTNLIRHPSNSSTSYRYDKVHLISNPLSVHRPLNTSRFNRIHVSHTIHTTVMMAKMSEGQIFSTMLTNGTQSTLQWHYIITG